MPGSGESVELLDDDSNDELPNDTRCFKCKKDDDAAALAGCARCVRSYHPQCLGDGEKPASSSEATWHCPKCAPVVARQAAKEAEKRAKAEARESARKAKTAEKEEKAAAKTVRGERVEGGAVLLDSTNARGVDCF